MLRIKILVVAVLFAVSPMAYGQGAGVKRNGFSEGGRQHRLTPDRVADHLKKLGREVRQTKHEGGAVTLSTTCDRGGRKCPVEVHCSADGKKLKIVCPLCNPCRFSSEKLLQLLGHQCRRGHFFFRAADSMLCFVDEDCPVAADDDAMQNNLDDVLTAMIETQPLWSDDAQAPPPVADVPAEAKAPMPSLAKTTMTGKEDLAGHGKLTFAFSSERDVVMIDTDGETPGTYSIEKDRITLTFSTTIIYTGTLIPTGITGTATNGRANWNFSVPR